MNYAIIGTCVTVILVVFFVIILKLKKNNKSQIDAAQMNQNLQLSSIKPTSNVNQEIAILLEQLPTETAIDESKLMEITDSKVLGRINNLIPEIFKAGTAAGNVVKGGGQVLYQAIIPAGAKLTESKDMAGAVRGIYHGADGIGGHANLVAANNAANVAANAAASAMGVASIVVGQYYMTQINSELSAISDSISKVAGFLNNEYKSKVYALITQIQKSASFQIENLENEELRNSEILKFDAMENECSQLLYQANFNLEEIINAKDIEYNKYEKVIMEVENWYQYQQVLLKVLYKIGGFSYALHLGAASKEQCYHLMPIHCKKFEETQNKLVGWHKKQCDKLAIDVNENHRKRLGFDAIIHKPLSWIKDDFSYIAVSENTINLITAQTDSKVSYQTDTKDLFRTDVRLIAKEGKVYYLPENDDDK